VAGAADRQYYKFQAAILVQFVNPGNGFEFAQAGRIAIRIEFDSGTRILRDVSAAGEVDQPGPGHVEAECLDDFDQAGSALAQTIGIV
jgi:hypothetical protein